VVAGRLDRRMVDVAPVDAVMVDDADQKVERDVQRVCAFQEAMEILDVGGGDVADHLHGEEVGTIGFQATGGGDGIERVHAAPFGGVSLTGTHEWRCLFPQKALDRSKSPQTGRPRMPAKLSVNLNAIALLRNRRDLPWPSVTSLGRIALQAGAHGLTVHPRPDQRHTRFSDLPAIRALIDDEFPHAEFNIEGYPTGDFLALAEDAEPEQITLVPDDPEQPTSDHGWDFVANEDMLKAIVARLKKTGARISLFCDPDASEQQIAAAKATGADRIELYTGPYGACHDDSAKAAKELESLVKTAALARAAGLGVNAGHDLTVANLPALSRAIPDLSEVSIGHGLTADALEFGMAGTVRRFLTACGW
jgi:pyridoxine 5-phosphate synthase